jgi:hypothetical protein
MKRVKEKERLGGNMEGQYTTPQEVATLVAVVLNSFVEEGDTEAFNFFVRVVEKTISLARARMDETVTMN